ncbi:MAG TPA: HNH endonuclease family protein [Candidatus Stackebrandtia excrementipullorum]|nr:HNH endonuclease family protein [Candidatus Stackebrandtia excrementipullorum]
MNRYPLRVGVAAASLIALSVASGCDVLDELTDSDSVSHSLTSAVEALEVAPEQRDGYDRDLFKHWIDEDGDGCNTRYEVLIEEAVTAPTVDDDCNLTGGEWTSYYDGETVDDPKRLHIDHVVPLAEAWDSGADSWSDDRRRAFANDMGDERSLIAVTAGSNTSKSDRDPAEWLPEIEAEHCRYVTEWVAVKTRWSLAVDDAERDVLVDVADGCEATEFAVEVVDDSTAAHEAATVQAAVAPAMHRRRVNGGGPLRR